MLSFSSVYFFKLSGIECGPVIVIDSELQNLSLSFTVSKGWIISAAAAAAAKSRQLCPTLCDPIDGSPPGSPIPGILQARTLEWPFPSPLPFPSPVSHKKNEMK